MQETLVNITCNTEFDQHFSEGLLSIQQACRKAAAHLRTHVVENTEQAPLLRTGRDVAEIIRSLDFTSQKRCGELERHPETQRGAVSASAGERH